MLSISFFIFGLFLGWFLAFQRQEQIEKQREKRKFSEEIELRSTPDTYLSKFDLIRKRYYEAKFKKMTKSMINRKGIPMTEAEIQLRKASNKR